MSGNQPANLRGEPLNMGLSIFAPISSVAGSSSLLFGQPLLTGSVSGSTAILIGSELFLFIARRLFQINSLPVLNASNGQTVQMSLTELQEFLRWMANGIGETPTINPLMDSATLNGRVIDNTGFITTEPPEAPLTVALYFSAFYSNYPYTPSVTLFIPILAFPGIRGALPLLILGLLSTIFTRAVVPPESTGSKPFSRPRPGANTNNSVTYTPNDLLQLLSKFGKYFKTNK